MSRPPARDTAAPPDLPGYRFVRRLGAGGNAQVYLYEQDLPKREVAVKVLNESALSEAARSRFTAEANVTASLPHPHIVQVFDAKVTPDGRPYIVMPFYPQPNLSVQARRSRFSVPDVLRIGIQVGSAVETSHRLGVLHRDIKPQNILTGSYGPALTDFGIATTIGGDGPDGMSVPWSPPEILYGTAPGDRRSDVYSLGATLWHLLAGRSPFEVPGGDNGNHRLMNRVKSDPVPRTGRADVPDSLERLLRQAMAKDPAARPQTAIDLVRALQSIEHELRLPPTQPTLPADASPGGQAPGDTVTSGGAWGTGNGYADTRTGTASPGAAIPWGTDAPPQQDDATRRRLRRIDPWPAPGAASGGAASPGAVSPGVMGPGAAGPGAAPYAEDDPTRARTPVRLDPWAAAGASGPDARSRQFPEAHENPTVARPRDLGRASGAGQARPVDPFGRTESPAASGTGPPGQRGRTRGRALALAGGGAALAVVAAAVLVLSQGGGQPSPASAGAGQATRAGGAQDAIGPGAAAPGTPAVTASRADPGHVLFRWTYSGHAAGDTFRWQVVSGKAGTTKGMTAKPRLRLPVAHGQSLCIEVQVRRRDGTASSQSKPACWPT